MVRRFSPFIALLLAAEVCLAGEAPVVELKSATDWHSDRTTIAYVVFDADDDVDGALEYSLHIYPDANLGTTQDVLTFATLIANQQDVLLDVGSGEFVESSSSDDVQSYTWADPDRALQNQAGFAPASAFFPGRYYLYLVARDGDNEPVMAVSDFAVNIRDTSTAVSDVTWGAIKAAR